MDINATARENLTAIADTFRKATGLSLATISRRFYGHRSFFAELRTGKRSLSFAKASEVLQAFSNEWPPGVEWPQTQAISMRRPRRKKSV